MSFAASWLDLRAAADTLARDPRLLAAAAAHLGTVREPVAVDLGCGAGATVAAFARRAGNRVRWRLVDADADLLRLASARFGSTVQTIEGDLGELAALPLEGARLVTASALFDLMPEGWIGELAERLSSARMGLYAALSYDGLLEWEPALHQDEAIIAAFNAHQRRDKGLGPAAGPGAGAALIAAMRGRGFAVDSARSDWRLGPEQAALQCALLEGIAAAAREAGAAGTDMWLQARLAASASATCIVGHLDVLALPRAGKEQSNTTSVSRP